MSGNRSGSNSRGKTEARSGTSTVSDSKKAAQPAEPKAAAVPAAARRRLGRGLSSLLNEAIAVTPPSLPAPSVMPGPVAAPAPSAPPAPATPPIEASTAPGAAALEAPTAPAANAARDVGDSDATDDGSGPRVVPLPVESVGPSPFQPRRVFDESALERLAASIREAGVMQPILVRRASAGVGGAGGESGKRYELVAGERRWRAAQLAGLAAVPAIIAELGDEQAAEWALIENVQREELGAMERAWALRSLVDRFGLTHATAAEKVGLDRSSVTNLIRLTDLEEPIRLLLEEGKLGVGHGKALLTAPAGPGRVALARRAAEGGWSVRRLERAASATAQSLAGAPAPEGDDAEKRTADRAKALGREELEKQLGEHLGTKVRVITGRGGARGRLVVEFYDLDHFDGLMGRIGFQIQ